MAKRFKKVDLKLEIDVLTAESVAEFVNAIFEFLLYQRNQIPFVYKTYKHLIAKFSENNENDNVENSMVFEQITCKEFRMQRQREKAQQTKNEISEMRELIRKCFVNNTVKSARFLFGATTFTAKESYTIHIPIESISKQHFHQHHPITHARINQSLLTLSACEELYATFSKHLTPTNIYLELETLENFAFGNSEDKPMIFQKDVSLLPTSCENIHFHIVHMRPQEVELPQCCRTLPIFDDFISMDATANSLSENQQNLCNIISNPPAWWEADIVVRGFKEQSKKSFSIWSN